jgi:hypothetical protein
MTLCFSEGEKGFTEKQYCLERKSDKDKLKITE